MISCEVLVSRLPVGSSASNTARRIDQRARDGDALLLAAGKLRRRIALAVAEPEQLERSRARVARSDACAAPLSE